MKQLLNKFKNLNVKQKNTFYLILFAVISIGIVIKLGISYSQVVNGPFDDQTVSGLEFKNAELEYEDGLSRYTVDVTNTLKEKYNLNSINIIFKDKDGKEIVTLLGYIGEEIDVSETKLLDTSIDIEISNIDSIKYVVNK